MRSPVYRNLDRPYQLAGFRPVELVLASATYLVTAEFAREFGVGRQWPMAFTAAVVALIFFARRYLGLGAGARTLRFALLPAYLLPQLRRPGGDRV